MYQLDATAAREADNLGGYLNESGKYIGKFTRAEKLVSKTKGTHGIGFTFEAQDKRTTRFDIWTMKPDNEYLMGYKAVNAIMACMKIRNVTVVQGQVDRYNYDTQQTEKVQAEIFPELVGKPIGLLLRNTEYEKMQDGVLTGQTGWRLELVMPFEAETEFTSSEILDRKTQPQKLANAVALLADRPLKKRPANGGQQRDDGYGSASAVSTASRGFDEEDPDIPF